MLYFCSIEKCAVMSSKKKPLWLDFNNPDPLSDIWFPNYQLMFKNGDGKFSILQCAISAYRHWSCEFESRSWRGVLDTTLCDKVCQWLATGWWFSPGTPVSSTNKTDHFAIAEILLKVALSTITLTNIVQGVDIYKVKTLL